MRSAYKRIGSLIQNENGCEAGKNSIRMVKIGGESDCVNVSYSRYTKLGR